jgi:plasmid stabilization system protein ParE
MFTPMVSVDIEEAHQWYEAQRVGLGDEFRASLTVVWKLLTQFPEAGPVVHRDLRRVLLPRFPFSVYYRVVGQAVEVRGCLHQHRNPNAWRRRV